MEMTGVFGGIVEDNKDPQKLGRLKVRVPHVYGAVGGTFGGITTNDLPWALPVGLPNGLSQQSGGADWTPAIGDQVLVQFLDAEPEKPVWLWFMQSQSAAKDFQLHSYAQAAAGSVGSPNRGAWVRYGHTVEWNTDGLILTTSRGYRLLITDASLEGNDGDISMATQGGQFYEMDDSTGDTTQNVSNDLNVNVGSQLLITSDSYSLTTINNEIELISGDKLTIDTVANLEGTIQEDWSMSVTGDTTFDLTGDLSISGENNIDLSATLDLSLSSTQNMSLDATGTLDVTSTGEATFKSSTTMNVEFLQLNLGAGAASPFVLGDQLLTYLDQLFAILVSHVHEGVFPGSSATGPMTPPPLPPPPSLLSAVIKGK